MQHAKKYSLTIKIDHQTLKELHDHKYFLYGFRGVSTEAIGKPIVWFAQDNFGESNHIDWISPVQAYGGLINKKLSDGTGPSFPLSKNINFGETLIISDHNGLGYIGYEGDPDHFSITSECPIIPPSDQTLSCGLSSFNSISCQFTPFCVFPIEHGQTYQMKCIDLVFLAFATEQFTTSSICSKLASEGVLIDMSSGEKSISFKNFHWESSAGVEIVKPNTDFTSKLIRTGDKVVLESQGEKVPLKEKVENIGERREEKGKENAGVGPGTKEFLFPSC